MQPLYISLILGYYHARNHYKRTQEWQGHLNWHSFQQEERLEKCTVEHDRVQVYSQSPNSWCAERWEQQPPAVIFKREKETYLTGKKWCLILLENPQK